MDDDDESGDEQAEPALPKVAAGIVAAAAGLRLGPGAALALGAASPLYEALAVKSWTEFWPGAHRRAAQMLETAAEEADLDAEELADRIASSDQAQLQTALAMDAAERTTWPPQVKALGKVLAAGLIAENDAVDLPQFALSAMTELDRVHIILLELLVRFEPEWTPGGGVKAIPHTVPSTQPVYLGGSGPDNPLEWRAGRRKWTAGQIGAARPQLQQVFAGVAGTLVRHGLAEQNDRRIERIEQITRDLQQMQPSSVAPRMAHDMERSWSPSELGEQVLGFYMEASTDSLEDN